MFVREKVGQLQSSYNWGQGEELTPKYANGNLTLFLSTFTKTYLINMCSFPSPDPSTITQKVRANGPTAQRTVWTRSLAVQDSVPWSEGRTASMGHVATRSVGSTSSWPRGSTWTSARMEPGRLAVTSVYVSGILGSYLAAQKWL